MESKNDEDVALVNTLETRKAKHMVELNVHWLQKSTK